MIPTARAFTAKLGIRERVPLLVGLMGPSGSGKTFSALRLATGIQAVTGGDIFVIDTEARRALHYADLFKFQHIDFKAPFGSLDYLAAIEHCVAKGAGVVVVDSFSHEHESAGGLLDAHDKELDRIAGEDWAKRERVKMLAWQKPKAARQRMLNTILQMTTNFVFCFRAKEKVKPAKNAQGKSEVKPMGFMPIAGEEIIFEMTVNCLLLPKSDGVPTWRSDEIGERQMMKLPEQFKVVFAEQRPLDESTGTKLAQWAKGGAASPGHTPPPGSTDAASAQTPTADAEVAEVDESEQVQQWDRKLTTAAALGWAALRSEWESVPEHLQDALRAALEKRHKPNARAADLKAKATA